MKADRDVVKITRLIRKKDQYPHLIDLINATFLEVLEQRKIASRDSLEQEVLDELQEEGLPPTEENRKEYLEALVDSYFAEHFSSAEIEDYINLARKREKAQTLSMIVNQDHATSIEINAALREFCEIPMGEIFISREEAEGIRVALIDHFISNQLPFVTLAKNHITIRDMDLILQRSLWSRKRSGKLGGKAAGMILALKILLPLLEKHDPELAETVRIPDTWYLNSGVFSEFMDRNNLYLFHTFKYKDRETIEKEFLHIEEKFKTATFAPEVLDDFRKILEEIGQHPIIIRSSSLLEDNFGLAFSGKYLSVFLTNQGDLATRLERFVEGLKRVFCSVFGPDPILYRLDHGLLDFDERMAMVVQKVVGRRWGDYFFPFVAGVLFSRNVYAWNPKIKKEEGLGRLVLGLGTRAVDRVGSDYPRMVALSHPLLRPEITAGQIKKYSQKQVDALNLKTGAMETVDFRNLVSSVSHPDFFFAVSMERDGHLSPPLFRGQEISGEPCLTFENFLGKTPFVSLAKKILSKIEKVYGRPIDLEFAWDENQFFLLQCRSLSTRRELEKVVVPENIPPERVLFSTHSALANSIVEDLEYIVYVNPRAYDQLTTFEEKMEIARVVNRCNKFLAGKRYALFGPGRWGSNDINLGVRVTYADINRARLLVEVAFAKEGYTPEVSYGTHFFQDLVEADIVIVPLFPDDPGIFFNESFLLSGENSLTSLVPDGKPSDSVVRLLHVPTVSQGQFLQVYLDGVTSKGVGFLAPKVGGR